MIPETGQNDMLEIDFEEEQLPNKTFSLQHNTRNIGGYTDGLEAIKQAIYCVLSTERYAYPIYSWDYGVELRDLFGMPWQYVASEIPVRFSDALLQDDRIIELTDFKITRKKKALYVTFTAVTTLGEIAVDKEVDAVV